MFKQWFGISRKFYNEAVNHYNDKDKTTINWMEVAKQLTHSLTEDYIKSVPYQIKKIAVKDCYQSYLTNCRKTKKSKIPFKLKYRTRKSPDQSCYIPKSALKENGIYYKISGKLKYSEKEWLNSEWGDCRLIKEYDRWYIVIPIKVNSNKLSISENQWNGDVVAIDPGIRSFLTIFSENGHYGQIGEGSFNKILNLQIKIDKLISLKERLKDKNKKRCIKRSIGRIRHKIRDLVDELHWKSINYLVRNYNVIILPSFEVSDMIKKGHRKIRKSVVRSMLSYRFYEFGKRLEGKCKEYGVKIIRSNESYTSKTNSFNGEIMSIGSREWFKYDGVKVNRDINGARNILLRAMRDGSVNG